MQRAYKAATAASIAELEALEGRIAERESNGEPPSETILWMRQRIIDNINELGRNLQAFADEGTQIAKDGQAEAAKVANDATEGLVEAAAGKKPANVSIGTSWTNLPDEQLQAFVGFAGDGSPLAELFNKIPQVTTNAMEMALVQGISLGEGPRTVARRVRRAADIGRQRAETIARTEMIRSAREAQRQLYTENGSVTGYRRQATQDARVCLACLALSGTLHKTDEIMPSHPNCFVPDTKVTHADLLGTSSRWYTGEVVTIKVKSGNVITVTPNHPILTSHGWVSAGKITKGFYVVSATDSKRMHSLVNPNYNHVESTIKDVVDAFEASLGVSSKTVEVSAMNFHGDGVGSEIAVINSDSLLRDKLIAKHESKGNLITTAGDSSTFSGLSDFASMFESVFASSDCIVCGSHIDGVDITTSSAHHQPISSGLISNNDVILDQDSTNHIASDIEIKRNVVLALAGYVIGYDGLLGQVINNTFSDASSRKQACANNLLRNAVQIGNLLEAFTGLINLDEVIDVQIEAYSGHVYNLQTSTGWYIANNIISHNCRCVMVPATMSWAEITGDDSIPDTRPPVATPEKILAGLSDADKLAIMGPARFEMYKNGKPLLDMVQVKQDKDWGPTTRVLPLKDIGGPLVVTPPNPPKLPKQVAAPKPVEVVKPQINRDPKALLEEFRKLRPSLRSKEEINADYQAYETERQAFLQTYRDAKLDVVDGIKEWHKNHGDRLKALKDEQKGIARIPQDVLEKMHELMFSADSIEPTTIFPKKALLSSGQNVMPKEYEQSVTDAVNYISRFVDKRPFTNHTKMLPQSLDLNEMNLAIHNKKSAYGYCEWEDLGIIALNKKELVFSETFTKNFSNTTYSRTLAHEIMHWIDVRDSRMRKSVSDFFLLRTKDDANWFKSPYGGAYKPDKWPDPYCGQRSMDVERIVGYGLEVPTRGMEYLLSNPLKFAEDDFEYFSFMITEVLGTGK
jgi:SPP1 gp7 family putative phage head morphogenesis protein